MFKSAVPVDEVPAIGPTPVTPPLIRVRDVLKTYKTSAAPFRALGGVRHN